jgi:hypothetical protein
MYLTVRDRFQWNAYIATLMNMSFSNSGNVIVYYLVGYFIVTLVQLDCW